MSLKTLKTCHFLDWLTQPWALVSCLAGVAHRWHDTTNPSTPTWESQLFLFSDSFTHMLCSIEKKVDIWDKVFSVMLHCPISHISPERGLWLCLADCDKWLTVSFDGLVCNTLFPWRSLQVSLLPSLAALSCSLSLLWPVSSSSPFSPHPLSLSCSMHSPLSPWASQRPVIINHTVQCFAIAFQGASMHMMLSYWTPKKPKALKK